MGALLGPVGGLQELRCASSLDVEPVGPELLSVTGTIGGGEYAQVSARRRSRVWNVGVGTARPHEMHTLAQMERRVRTHRETLVFYDEAAQVENLLDPDASLMALEDPLLDPAGPLEGRAWARLTPGGARTIPGDGLQGPRFESSGVCSPDGTWAHLSNVPVPHRRVVTASIYLTAYVGQSAYFYVDELGMDNRTIRVHEASTTVGSGGEAVLDRLAHTFTTTDETVALSFGVSRAVTVVAPQLTLTDRPVDWVDGQGCVSAMPVAQPSKQVQAAYMTPHDAGRRSAYSWQIREVQQTS